MIQIESNVNRNIDKFWNNCLFHPTDAVEDPWGKKILDKMAKDKGINTIRIYAMLEDIVYLDDNNELAYDFRINDLRLDYLIEKGYDILIAYGMMPNCIASQKNALSNMSKNSTRYKGKLINTSIPTDYKLWEEVCFQYTKHLVDRYGVEMVSKWHCHCWNEPDGPFFFMSNIDGDDVETRIKEYGKLYSAFVDGVSRACSTMHIGGPGLACFDMKFINGFLKYVKESNTRLDYISMHNYSTLSIKALNEKTADYSVEEWVRWLGCYIDIIEEYGFADKELIIDEWGMCNCGFFNIEECPSFIARENEIFSSYFAKLIKVLIDKEWKISKLMICLSGQHEMVTDFSGFRNFFTLNFFAKPIYNTYILSSKLHNGLLNVNVDNENIFVTPTKNEDGQYSLLLTYSSENFKEDLPEIFEDITFEENIEGRNVCIYLIDKETTNPYRMYEKMGCPEMGEDEIAKLREEGNLKPYKKFVADKNNITLKLTSNATYLVEVK